MDNVSALEAGRHGSRLVEGATNARGSSSSSRYLPEVPCQVAACKNSPFNMICATSNRNPILIIPRACFLRLGLEAIKDVRDFSFRRIICFVLVKCNSIPWSKARYTNPYTHTSMDEGVVDEGMVDEGVVDEGKPPLTVFKLLPSQLGFMTMNAIAVFALALVVFSLSSWLFASHLYTAVPPFFFALCHHLPSPHFEIVAPLCCWLLLILLCNDDLGLPSFVYDLNLVVMFLLQDRSVGA